MSLVRKVFLDHPKSVGESYFEHLANASRYGFTLAWAGFACIVHALVPALCRKTASNIVLGLSDELRARDAPAAAPAPAE